MMDHLSFITLMLRQQESRADGGGPLKQHAYITP